MSISDKLLAQLRLYLIGTGQMPAALKSIRLRDDSDTLEGTELVLTAEDPEEHETMPGMERITGAAIISLSVDDIHDADDRQWIAGQVNRLLRDGGGSPSATFEEWLDAQDPGVRSFGFRISGVAWDGEDRRVTARIPWACWACATA